MATMHIVLPDALQHWVEDQADAGRYETASDYVRDLIRRDQERSGKIAAMQRLIDDARMNGLSPLSPDDIMELALERFRATSRPDGV